MVRGDLPAPGLIHESLETPPNNGLYRQLQVHTRGSLQSRSLRVPSHPHTCPNPRVRRGVGFSRDEIPWDRLPGWFHMWRELGMNSLRSGDYYAGIQMSVFPSSRQQVLLVWGHCKGFLDLGSLERLYQCFGCDGVERPMLLPAL